MGDEARYLRCIYCDGRHKKDPRMSVEHIWPQSLGGDYCSKNLFLTDQVCKSCNDLAGQWVDAAFTKSWFVKSDHFLGSRMYCDPDKIGALPLTYMGFDEEFPWSPSEVCERWIGPAGEHIYHIHLADRDDWRTFAGGDFLKRKTKDPGRVYYLLTSSAQYWFFTALISIHSEFSRSKIRCLTEIGNLDERFKILQCYEEPISEEERNEIDWIYARPPGMKTHRLDTRIDFADRFLAKISLGFARTLLGQRAVFTPYADELRKLLWSKTPVDRELLRVRGTGYWGADNEEGIANFLGWRGAWTIILRQIGTDCALMLITPMGKEMTIVISDDPSVWEVSDYDALKDGIVYIIVPQRKLSVGPILLHDFIDHKFGDRQHLSLVELQKMAADAKRLPPRLAQSDENSIDPPHHQ